VYRNVQRNVMDDYSGNQSEYGYNNPYLSNASGSEATDIQPGTRFPGRRRMFGYKMETPIDPMFAQHSANASPYASGIPGGAYGVVGGLGMSGWAKQPEDGGDDAEPQRRRRMTSSLTIRPQYGSVY
jgi:hypothetical protein